MGSTFDETVLDFDLNLLNSTTTYTNLAVQNTELRAKNERLRKAITILKKKVLFSHTAISRYKSARSYANILENNQVFSKEGCKQHLIEIRNFIEKVNKLENECLAAENREKEKNETIIDLQNKNEAHLLQIDQLNALVISERNKLDSTPVKIEKTKEKGKIANLEKEIEALRKRNIKILNLEKENETLRKENTKILKLEKVIEELLKKNSEISDSEILNKSLHKDNLKSPTKNDIKETLSSENKRIANLEIENETLREENARIPHLEKENETLSKENTRIPDLVKENETLSKENTRISHLEKVNETLHRENSKIKRMEKENEILQKETAKIKNLEKEIENYRKENSKIINMVKEIENLHKELDVQKEEKSKLQLKHNQLLRKYELLPHRNSNWCDNSDIENDMFEDVIPQITNNSILGKKAAKNMVPLELDNDYSTEVVSEDTGRGSSLASSDNEKYLHSPEYYLNDSLLKSREQNDIKIKPKVTMVSKASSPILFEDPITVHIENQSTHRSEKNSMTQTYPISLNTVERSVSPINVPEIVVSSHVTVGESIITNEHRQDVQIKECLELNNSLQSDSQDDFEIESILSCMQLHYGAVSPIPRTPTRLRFTESTTRVSKSSDVNKILQQLDIIEKLEQKLVELKKCSNKSIKEFLCKSDPSLTLISEKKSLSSQCDSNAYNANIINTDSNQIAHTESFERMQHSIEDSEVITDFNMEISDPVLSKDDNLAHTPNQPIETFADSFQNKGSETSRSHTLPTLQEENLQQAVILKSPVSEELMENNDISKDVVIIINPHNNVVVDKLPTKDSHVKKAKIKKNTKLEKLKKNLEPKYKIKKEEILVKSRVKPKPSNKIKLAINKNKLTVNETSASLNDKNVYAKAVKIMAEINSKRGKIAKPLPKLIKDPVSPKLTTNLEKQIDSNLDQTSPNCSIKNTTLSNNTYVDFIDNCKVVLTKDPLVLSTYQDQHSTSLKEPESDEKISRKRRRHSSYATEIPSKRILRSSTVNLRLSTEDNTELFNSNAVSIRKSIENSTTNDEVKKSSTQPMLNEPKSVNSLQWQQSDQNDGNFISYVDLDVFSEDVELEKETPYPKIEASTPSTTASCHPKESILCSMIQKYGVETVRPYAKKIPETTVKLICDTFEQGIAKIIEEPPTEAKNAMNSFVADLRKLNYKHFLTGMMKYLTKPERKIELFGKIFLPPAPAMTKAEQILLYVILNLKTNWPSVDIVDDILSNIEYTLFKLNRTPEFDVIESTSHFYAVLCRYFGARSRLRLFILDAMYCIQFKSVPLIKQCLDVWMHIIPLAHMGIAKSPLVTCLVYLLHFYKCDDKFNRVNEIRNILSRKYFYQFTDWNEKKILEMFKNSIMDLRDVPIERKMLRLALIILAKRQGPRWCQNNIIKNLLQPMIDKEAPKNVRVFCVSMIGPLMKPYPVDMKVHCEIAINQLSDILNDDPSPEMEEAVITSMMFINRHNQYRINQTLLTRKMKPMSLELEKILREYVRTRTLKIWKKSLSKLARF